jgi:hypothetical protein
MAENSDDLERLSREQLILKARVLGVERAELMTRVEMRDEIVRRSEPDIAQQKRARGFLGVARDLVASVVEAGLNLPDAAALIRGDGNRENHWKGPPPVATVTLAEIYATQGHLERALRMLDEVLLKEPDHDAARALRTRLASATDLPVSPTRRRQKIAIAAEPEPAIAAEPEPAIAAEPDLTPASAPVNVPVPVPAPASASPLPLSPPASLLTLSLAGQRQVYWELSPASLSSLRAHSPSGRPVVRVISFRTRAGRVERHTSDLNPDSEIGFAVLPNLGADAVIRAVLGWEAEGRFMPYLVASDLASGTPSARRSGPFRANPLVGPVAHEVELRALSHCSRRPAH